MRRKREARHGSPHCPAVAGGARQRDVIIAIVVSVLVMTPIVLGSVIPHFPLRWLLGLAWPWYVPLGTAVTVGVGWVASLVRESW
jgi:hypothetical protein